MPVQRLHRILLSDTTPRDFLTRFLLLSEIFWRESNESLTYINGRFVRLVFFFFFFCDKTMATQSAREFGSDWEATLEFTGNENNNKKPLRLLFSFGLPYLSFSPPICWSFSASLPVSLFMSVSFLFLEVFTYLCIHVCTYLSIYLPIYLCTYLPIYLSNNLYVQRN